MPRCPICDSQRLTPRTTGGGARCEGCGSDGRTRLMWLVLAHAGRLRPGLRVLHLAPEYALAPRFAALWGDGYEPADLNPAAFPWAPGARRIDLVTDAARLPGTAYDLILHAHVMEHVPANVTAILWHLHRALRPDGLQICCIPLMPGRHSAEDLGPLPPDMAEARFGQADHVRLFGALDVHRTLGMLFRLPADYDAAALLGEDALRDAAVPERAWRGWSAQSVLALAKDDLLLA